jgi:hypothetical protein
VLSQTFFAAPTISDVPGIWPLVLDSMHLYIDIQLMISTTTKKPKKIHSI